jgi:hypothetical protein
MPVEPAEAHAQQTSWQREEGLRRSRVVAAQGLLRSAGRLGS